MYKRSIPELLRSIKRAQGKSKEIEKEYKLKTKETNQVGTTLRTARHKLYKLQLQLTQICEDRATKIHPDDTYLEHIKRYWYLNHYGEISEVSHPNIYEFRKAVELGNAYYNRASALEAKEELKRRLT